MGGRRRRFIGSAVMAAIFSFAAAPASAYEGASRGSIDKVEVLAPRVLKVTATLRCTEIFEGCAPRTTQIYATPRRLKVFRQPRVVPFHPAVARPTTCQRGLGVVPEAWNTEETVLEWQRWVRGYGSKGQQPPVELVYRYEEALLPGTHTVTAIVKRPYGAVQACLFLLSWSSYEGAVEGCLPEFKPSIRNEFCEQEYGVLVTPLDHVTVGSGSP